MGATTFSRSKRNKARKLRESGRIEEANVMEESFKRFIPKKDENKEPNTNWKGEKIIEVEEEKDLELDLDGDGKPDTKVSKRPFRRIKKIVKK